jgi:hypothetical protein
MSVKDLQEDRVMERLNNFEWAGDLETVKKQGEEILRLWQWTKKLERTLEALKRATTIEKVQQIVYNTAFSGAKLKVIM